MRIKISDAFRAILNLVEGDIRAGVEFRAPSLAVDDYFSVLRRTIEQEKYEFQGKWRIPIVFVIQMPRADLAALDAKGLRVELPEVLTRKMVEYVKTKGYIAAGGPIAVTLERSTDQETHVVASFKRGVASSCPANSADGSDDQHGDKDSYSTVIHSVPVAVLEITAEKSDGPRESIPLSMFPVTIGREAPDNPADFQIEAHPEVGRQHVRIQRGSDGSFTVTDLNSKNGTSLNGKKIAAGIPVDLPFDSILVLAGRVWVRFLEMHGTRRAA